MTRWRRSRHAKRSAPGFKVSALSSAALLGNQVHAPRESCPLPGGSSALRGSRPLLQLHGDFLPGKRGQSRRGLSARGAKVVIRPHCLTPSTAVSSQEDFSFSFFFQLY